MNQISKYAWMLLLIAGIGMAIFAYDNLVVIPTLDPADPDRGWAWLTSDPEVIEYIKFWFRNFGFWVLAVSVFVMVTSVTGYRQGDRWAWFALLYLPIHIAIHMVIWPWTIPILAVLLLLVLAGLFLPYRRFFPHEVG